MKTVFIVLMALSLTACNSSDGGSSAALVPEVNPGFNGDGGDGDDDTTVPPEITVPDLADFTYADQPLYNRATYQFNIANSVYSSPHVFEGLERQAVKIGSTIWFRITASNDTSQPACTVNLAIEVDANDNVLSSEQYCEPCTNSYQAINNGHTVTLTCGGALPGFSSLEKAWLEEDRSQPNTMPLHDALVVQTVSTRYYQPFIK